MCAGGAFVTAVIRAVFYGATKGTRLCILDLPVCIAGDQSIAVALRGSWIAGVTEGGLSRVLCASIGAGDEGFVHGSVGIAVCDVISEAEVGIGDACITKAGDVVALSGAAVALGDDESLGRACGGEVPDALLGAGGIALSASVWVEGGVASKGAALGG